MRPCPAAPCWRLAVAVLSLALTGELALAMALGLTLALAPLPALAMALALTLAMAAAMRPAVVAAVALALVGGGAAAGHVCVLSGAVKRQHDPRDAAGGEFVWRMSLRLASAMTPRLPAALPAAGETCISREWTVLSCCARWLMSWTATCCPCRNDLECLFDENGSPQLVEAIPSWRVFVLGGTADTVGEGRFRASRNQPRSTCWLPWTSRNRCWPPRGSVPYAICWTAWQSYCSPRSSVAPSPFDVRCSACWSALAELMLAAAELGIGFLAR